MLNQSMLISALGRAIEGQRVWFMASSQKDARAYFLGAPTDLQGAEYRRTNGNESITFPGGGVLHFQSLRSGGRGFLADRVYVPSSISDTDLANVIPGLASSKDGAAIYY